MRSTSWPTVLLASFAVLAAAVPAAADPVHAKATKYDNVHIRVSDPAKATEWYVKHLGARGDNAPGRVYFGDTVISIVRTANPQPSAGSVIDHFAVSYPDLKARIRTLTAAGIKVAPVKGHTGFSDAVLVEDPWGVSVELLQEPGNIAFHHVHLSVPDPRAALAWYTEHLGGERGRVRGLEGLRYGSFWLLADKSAAPSPAASADRAIMNVAFRVDDIHKAIDELKGKGVQVVTPPTRIRDLWYAFVEGPNGVRTELLQRPR